MLKVWFFHALEYRNRLGCWYGSPKDYSNHWPSLTFMGNTAATEKQENRVWVAQGITLIWFKINDPMPFWTPHCSNDTHNYDIVITFILLFEYPTTTTSSISWDVYREQRSLRRCHRVDNHWFPLDNIMLLVFATLFSPSPSIRCSLISHSLDAVIVLSLIHIWRCRRSTLCRSRWSPYH